METEKENKLSSLDTEIILEQHYNHNLPKTYFSDVYSNFQSFFYLLYIWYGMYFNL